MRPWTFLLPILAIAPSYAAASDAPYYGPMKAWHGIGFKFGYKEERQADGSWRVVAATRSGDAIDMALYRAAELANDAGFAYVQLLGGTGSRSPGVDSATLYARPASTAAVPTTCRSKRYGTCYTAVVAQILHRLGGASGKQGGVPIVDHLDRYGRQVSYSGYGTGAATFVPLPAMAYPAPPPVRVPAQRTVSAAPRADPAVDFERALKAAQPVRGKEPTQGWTISD